MSEKHVGKRILDYFVKTLNGMALGLFATLIIGVIIGQIATLTGIEALTTLSGTLRSFMGIGIGIGIAWSLKLQGLSLIAGGVAGGIATSLHNDPVVAYVTTVLAIEGLRLVLRKKTPIDIILIPLLSSIIAFAVATLIGAPIAGFMQAVGRFIEETTTLQPFFMGIIIAVIMGMALTAPISSAAIAISIGLSGLAGGAALVGGATQMIGFAVMSRKDNSFGAVLSIAFGTSMLQFKNVLRKPILWLPPILVSAVLGPFSTLVFRAQTSPVGAGMGTSGLVGQIATLDVMGYGISTYVTIALLHFILPITLVLALDVVFRLKGWITEGDFDLTTE